MSASVSNLAAREAGEAPDPIVSEPVARAHSVLAATERHPDAPSAVPLYLRALLELAVLREHREASAHTIIEHVA